MAKDRSKNGKKGIGRSKRKSACLRYANSERWKINKVRRIVKHMLKFPNYLPFNLSQEISDKVAIEMKKAS